MKLKLSKKVVGEEPNSYRDGADGMIAWCDDHVYVPIYPIDETGRALFSVWCRLGDLPDTPHPRTGKSYAEMWGAQKTILRRALQMADGEFKYRLIVFCWPRGEGKSLLAVLIQLWKFFNWPRQQIMLGANSRDQVKFVHYDIMKDIILNSPPLMAMTGNKRNIQEKEIRLKDLDGNVKSLIRSISSFSGIVSNITGYTFSEIFDMKKPKFFSQLDGSIRNIPNAIGVIDSTVSSKTHLLYSLFQSFVTGKSRTIFFSYRSSKMGDLGDYWNPNMTEDQLRDYEIKFPFGDYERYFLNLWSAGARQIFSQEMIEEIGIIGADDGIINHGDIKDVLEKKNHLIEVLADLKSRGLDETKRRIQNAVTKVDKYNERLKSVENLYTISEYSAPRMASFASLMKLSDVFDTNFAVLSAVDFGDPYALSSPARTVMVILAKGLPGSKTNPYQFISGVAAPMYIYFTLYVKIIPKHDHSMVKQELDLVHNEYGGLDVFCSERFGAWDIQGWCDGRGVKFEPIYPNYDKQREAFKAVLEVVRDGRFKAPFTGVTGTKKPDILKEEFEMFNHDEKGGTRVGWFGSTEKGEKFGIQDDYMFANAWCMFGGRSMSAEDFRIRRNINSFGTFVANLDLVGDYG